MAYVTDTAVILTLVQAPTAVRGDGDGAGHCQV